MLYIIMNGVKREVEISELPQLPQKEKNPVHYVDIPSSKTGKWYSFYSDGERKNIYQLEVFRSDGIKSGEHASKSNKDITVDITGGAIFL